MRATEQQLKAGIASGLAGHVGAHHRLWRELLPVLRGFFRRRLTGHDDDVEDLVQEVLIAVHTRRVTYDVGRPFGGWLFGIARNRLIDHFRRRGRTVPIEGLEDILIAESVEDAAIARADIGDLLALLPAKQAAASATQGWRACPRQRRRRGGGWANRISRSRYTGA